MHEECKNIIGTEVGKYSYVMVEEILENSKELYLTSTVSANANAEQMSLNFL